MIKLSFIKTFVFQIKKYNYNLYYSIIYLYSILYIVYRNNTSTIGPGLFQHLGRRTKIQYNCTDTKQPCNNPGPTAVLKFLYPNFLN